jgi:hypothetical protein
MDTPMAKLCVDCVHYRAAIALKGADFGGTGVARCAATHNHVVGDGVEWGQLWHYAWKERTALKPGEDSFKCGPEAKYWEEKPAPPDAK